MIKIKIKQSESRNRKPIEKVSVDHTPTKISGFGAVDDYTKTSGHDYPAEALPRYGMEGYDPNDNELGYEKKSVVEEFEIDEDFLYEKKDRCYHLAKQKYDVFPSAYASGFIVRCRKGKVAKKKNESLELEEIADFILEEEWSDKYKRSIDCNNPKGFSQRAHCQSRKKSEESLELEEMELEEGTFDKEKSQGLHGWFARQGGKGKRKGWVDCNTCRTNPETGRKTCKSCGRESGEKRSKYPACRPTASACTKTGTSKKKSSSRVNWKSKKKEEE